MKVVELLEQDEWANNPLSDDDPKSIDASHRRAVSITNQLNAMYDYLTALQRKGIISISGRFSTKPPPNDHEFDQLPTTEPLGTVYIKKDADSKLKARIAHTVNKYQKINKLHANASAEATRIHQLHTKKKQEKRELNKLKREHARELERAKK